MTVSLRGGARSNSNWPADYVPGSAPCPGARGAGSAYWEGAAVQVAAPSPARPDRASSDTANARWEFTARLVLRERPGALCLVRDLPGLVEPPLAVLRGGLPGLHVSGSALNLQGAQ